MPTDIQAPEILYGPLSPMLIVFAAATLGVLVEAFASARNRRTIQVVIAVGGLLAALVAIAVEHDTNALVASDAIAIDGPTLFLQAILAVLGILGILLLGERNLDSSGGAVVAQASATPGS